MEELLFYLSLFIFVILACIIVVARFTKPAPTRAAEDEDEIITFETLLLPLEFSSSNNDQLEQAVRRLFRYYDELDMTTTQKRFFLYALSKHPNVRAELVLEALDEMSNLNPSIAKELEASVKRGLDRRDLVKRMV
ncbi:hypothetical protein [uncultured Helicobacter sp.]|uniref:hypothetical protein n=1 Tax=Helicobacter sp. TaxID=218 RepID=UPI002616D2AE|nr:hypothetical protein [uncultured Helicobacter sp.]